MEQVLAVAAATRNAREANAAMAAEGAFDPSKAVRITPAMMREAREKHETAQQGLMGQNLFNALPRGKNKEAGWYNHDKFVITKNQLNSLLDVIPVGTSVHISSMKAPTSSSYIFWNTNENLKKTVNDYVSNKKYMRYDIPNPKFEVWYAPTKMSKTEVDPISHKLFIKEAFHTTE
jgi:hypothetical protein